MISKLYEFQLENDKLKDDVLKKNKEISAISSKLAEKPKESVIYKEKEVVRLRDYTPEEIDNLPRVSALCRAH